MLTREEVSLARVHVAFNQPLDLQRRGEVEMLNTISVSALKGISGGLGTKCRYSKENIALFTSLN